MGRGALRPPRKGKASRAGMPEDLSAVHLARDIVKDHFGDVVEVRGRDGGPWHCTGSGLGPWIAR